jgi:transposase InsO family protein
VSHADARLTRPEERSCASASLLVGRSPTSRPRWASPAPAPTAGGLRGRLGSSTGPAAPATIPAVPRPSSRQRSWACARPASSAQSASAPWSEWPPRRLAYAEVLADERGDTCAGFLRWAGAFIAAHGIAVQRVLSDNAVAYHHGCHRQAELSANQRFRRPCRPQTNGKVERFNRTLLAEWAYVRPYTSNPERTAALHDWLHLYNRRRPAPPWGQLPISRVNNARNSYT